MMKNKVSMKSRITRTILSSALTATVVSAAIGLQPVTVLANVKEGSTLLDSFSASVPEPTIGGNPQYTHSEDATVHVQRLDWRDCFKGNTDENLMNADSVFEDNHTYAVNVISYGATVNDPSTGASTVYELSPQTTATINGQAGRLDGSQSFTIDGVTDVYNMYTLLFYTKDGILVNEDGTPLHPTPAPEPQPAPAPAPAPAPSPQQQNEQAALQQQAIERELQAAGVTAAAPASIVATVAPNGDFTNVKNIFSQAMKASPSIWGVYSRAAGGNTNAIYTMFSYALNGDQNALLALYAAASSGNPYAITSLQLLGLSL